MASRQRPEISDISSGDELKRWYWLKDELIARAKICGVKTSGGKFAILDRLAHFLDTSEKTVPGEQNLRAKSDFNWHSEALFPQTIITDSYKNSQNVRRFFKDQLGDKFKFNIAFMDWMKANVGKSLTDAMVEYGKQATEAAQPGFKTAIKPHNQFNQYTRDILAANPGMSGDDARRIWEKKRAQPSIDGRHIYEQSDLKL